MAGTTTALPTSFKQELLVGTHNFTASTGDDFKIALIKVGPAGTYGAGSTNYSNITGNSDEVTGTGYSAGGYDFTAAQNVTPTTSGTTAFTQWGINPTWTSASFSTTGCMIYNASKTNKAVYVGDFGGTQTVTAGTFTAQLPTNNSSSALIRIA